MSFKPGTGKFTGVHSAANLKNFEMTIRHAIVGFLSKANIKED